MIDVARHFYELDILKKVIDSMMIAKLNKLHLHLSDGDNFSLEIRGLPLNSEKHYTQDQMRELIRYGKLRGVEIIPELDTPAHTHSWSQDPTLKDINLCSEDKF